MSDKFINNLDQEISKENYTILFENNPQPMWIYDLETLKFLAVNNATIFKYGYSREEFYGMTIKDIRPSEDIKSLLNNISTIKEKYQFSAGWKHKLKNGSLIEVEILSHDILFRNRKARFVTVNDITERKKTEGKFRLVVESAPNAIILVNREGKITLANKQAEVLFGYSIDELINQSLDILIPARFSSSHSNYQKEFFNNPAKRIITERSGLYGLHKNGREIPLEIGLNPIEDGNGISVLASIIDITQRKKAEEEIRNAELRFRSTLDYMIEGFQIIGFDWRYLYINDVAAQQGHSTKEELLGHTMMEKYPGIENTEMFSKLRDCMENRIACNMENEFTYSDGSKNWFYLKFEPVPEGIFILSTNITKEKKAEGELTLHKEHLEELVVERTRQLESVNKELETFSYSVSHDLRAPLRAIDGYSGFLLEDYYDKLDDEGKRYLTVIKQNATQMGQLIDDLLAFSRMSRTNMNYTKINMNELASSVYEEIVRFEKKRNIEFHIADLPEVHGDIALMKQVWMNLISNAVKYTRKAEKAKIIIEQTEDEENVTYFIKDNGVGFDMKYNDKLFGVFQRLHKAADFEGNGVGLALVKRIIDRHGGTVKAEAMPDEGATFYFTLPKIREE